MAPNSKQGNKAKVAAKKEKVAKLKNQAKELEEQAKQMKQRAKQEAKEAKELEKAMKASGRQNPKDLMEGDMIKGFLPGRNYTLGVFQAYLKKQTQVQFKPKGDKVYRTTTRWVRPRDADSVCKPEPKTTSSSSSCDGLYSKPFGTYNGLFMGPYMCGRF